MTSFSIRPAQPDDFTAIQALNHLLFLYEKQFTSTYNIWWMYQERGINYFLNRLLNQDNNSIFLVADQGGVVIGYLTGHVSNISYRAVNPIAELENMFVLPEHRGRGVGTALIKEFVRQAKALGAKRFKVKTLSANHPAISFYQRFGFSPHALTLELES